jgi:hypothetical protein
LPFAPRVLPDFIAAGNPRQAERLTGPFHGIHQRETKLADTLAKSAQREPSRLVVRQIPEFFHSSQFL